MTEEQILAIDRAGDVANCAVTEYRLDATPGPARRARAAPLQLRRAAGEGGAPVTAEPDAPVAAAMSAPTAGHAATLLRACRCPQPRATTATRRARPRAGRRRQREVPGAVLLAGVAALRAGAGKLQIATAASIATASRPRRARGARGRAAGKPDGGIGPVARGSLLPRARALRCGARSGRACWTRKPCRALARARPRRRRRPTSCSTPARLTGLPTSTSRCAARAARGAHAARRRDGDPARHRAPRGRRRICSAARAGRLRLGCKPWSP